MNPRGDARHLIDNAGKWTMHSIEDYILLSAKIIARNSANRSKSDPSHDTTPVKTQFCIGVFVAWFF